jgi:hypothetical protein
MKKAICFLAVTLVLATSQIYGQSLYRTVFQKGSFLLGCEFAMGWGASNFYGDYEYHFNTTAFTLTPKAALFLTNGFALGIAADYTANKFNDYDFGVSTTDLSIGPLVRVYTYDGFFIQSSFTFGKMTKGLSKPDIRKFNIGIGYAFPVSKLVFIEPVVLYRNTKLKIEGEDGEGRIDQKLNEFVVVIGVGIYLHKQP